MKKILILCAAMALAASTAFAGAGIDLSVNACPGTAGAIGDNIPIDCAGGAGVAILGTFSPAEAISDLVGIDVIVDLYVAGGLDGAGFWDFDPTGCNAVALTSSHLRPTAGCSATGNVYTNTWSVAGAGSGSAAYYPTGVRGKNLRMALACARPTVLSVAALSKLFGFQLLIDGAGATEAGGTCDGCSQVISMAFNQCNPGSASGLAVATTPLTSPTGNFPGFSNCMGLQGLPDCQAVPTKKRTWGQLKSLYR